MFYKPAFWDKKGLSVCSVFLFPLSLMVILINFLTNLLPKKKYKIKSICVGNIYVGGTGKTPLAIELYKILKKKNLRLATAKKKYKYQLDEEILLKNHTNLITEKNRKKIFNTAIKKKIDLLIFDDGLQDITVDYDLKFICMKSENLFGNRLLIPAGPLREKISNLKNYDAIFLNGFKNNKKNLNLVKKINPKILIFETSYEIQNLQSLDKHRKYYIFSGIGDPKSFESILKKYKISIIDHKIFPDHYKYKKKDILEILKIAKKNNAKVLTTEKDYVKISKLYKNKICFTKIIPKIKKQEKLEEFLRNKLNEKI